MNYLVSNLADALSQNDNILYHKALDAGEHVNHPLVLSYLVDNPDLLDVLTLSYHGLNAEMLSFRMHEKLKAMYNLEQLGKKPQGTSDRYFSKCLPIFQFLCILGAPLVLPVHTWKNIVKPRTDVLTRLFLNTLEKYDDDGDDGDDEENDDEEDGDSDEGDETIVHTQ